MKKFSLILGTLGGAMAGYVFSNSKLREELAEAEDPDEVSAILKKHFKKDAKHLGKDVKDFLDSDEVQAYMNKMKKSAQHQVGEARKGVESWVSEGKQRAEKEIRKRTGARKSARKPARKTTKRKSTRRKK